MVDELIGKEVAEVRRMTDAEIETMGWHATNQANPTIMIFDDGTVIFPSQDPEGNGPGALFGEEPDGTKFGFR